MCKVEYTVILYIVYYNSLLNFTAICCKCFLYISMHFFRISFKSIHNTFRILLNMCFVFYLFYSQWCHRTERRLLCILLYVRSNEARQRLHNRGVNKYTHTSDLVLIANNLSNNKLILVIAYIVHVCHIFTLYSKLRLM